MIGVRVDVDAFRYALGRRSSAPADMAPVLIAHRDALPDWVRHQIVRDITDAVAGGRAGDPCDVDAWRRVLTAYERSSS